MNHLPADDLHEISNLIQKFENVVYSCLVLTIVLLKTSKWGNTTITLQTNQQHREEEPQIRTTIIGHQEDKVVHSDPLVQNTFLHPRDESTPPDKFIRLWMPGKFSCLCCHLLTFFFKITFFFQKIISGTLSECQMVWIQICLQKLSADIKRSCSMADAFFFDLCWWLNQTPKNNDERGA